MPVSYSPTLSVSDSPAKGPDERFFVGGGGSVVPIDPATLFTVGVTGDYWNTTVQASVTGAGGIAITQGADVESIASGRGTADVDYTTADGNTGDGLGSTFPMVWENNALAQAGAAFWSAPVSTNPAVDGIYAGFSFRLTGSADVDTIDFFWLNQTASPWYANHFAPFARSVTGTGKIRLELTDNAADNYTTTRDFSDGEAHSLAWVYDTSDGLFRIYVDGVLEGSFSPVGTVLSGNRVTMSSGDRSGIDHDSWAACVINKPVSALDAAGLHAYLIDNVLIQGTTIDGTGGSFSTDEDTTYNGDLTAISIVGGSISYTQKVGPTNGSLSITAPVFTYTPDENYNGSDSFVITASDGSTQKDLSYSVTVNAVPDVIFDDPFTDTNGTNLSLHAPTVDASGAGWSVAGGSFQIIGNELIYSNGGAGTFTAKTGDFSSSIPVTAEINPTAANDLFVLTIRYIDDSNHWRLIYNTGTGTLSVFEITSGSATSRGSSAFTAGQVPWLADNGSQITIGFDRGAAVITIASSTHNSSAVFGFLTNASANRGASRLLIVEGSTGPAGLPT